MACILHISDLHRDSDSRISNSALIESLRRDIDRCTAGEDIPHPQLLVVSGDIVFGVSGSDASADAALTQQYDEAYGFLDECAKIFFNNDRTRVVLAPGNHDVSTPHVLRSLTLEGTPAEDHARRQLAQQLLQQGSSSRWSWKDFSMYRITNTVEYEQRLKPYADFYNRFYGGSSSYCLDPRMQYSIHDFPDLGVVVASFSSCDENDIYNRVGRIHPDCVAGATRAVASKLSIGRVPIAVWHHSLQGGPRESDYLDSDILQSFMDGGFEIALHGHQHRPQIVEHRFTVDQKRRIAAVSAGTLCGGPRSLPSGRMRAYNLIDIDTANRQCTVHVREMKNSDFSLPVWGAAYVPDFSGASLKFKFTDRTRSASISLSALGQANELLRDGNAESAYELVRDYTSTNEIARRIAARSLSEMKKWDEIIRALQKPNSPEEFVVLCDAYYELGRKEELSNLINSSYATESVDPGVKQCISAMRGRLERT